MAKATAKEEITNVPAQTTGTEVATTYDYGQFASMGADQIESEDVSIPRLKLIQSMSPEAKDEIAKEGDFLHSITKQVIIPKGEKGICIPIFYSKSYVLWRDRKNGGGMFARATKFIDSTGAVRYRWDKPMETFEDKLEGKIAVKYTTKQYIDEDGLNLWGTQIPGDKDSGPAATETHTYIVVLPEHEYQVIAITLSRTAARKAKDLNFMIKNQGQRGVPMFALKFGLGSVIDTADGNSWANYAFAPAGLVPPNDPNFNTLAEMYKSFSGKKFTVHDEGGDEDARPANTDGGAF